MQNCRNIVYCFISFRNILYFYSFSISLINFSHFFGFAEAAQLQKNPGTRNRQIPQRLDVARTNKPLPKDPPYSLGKTRISRLFRPRLDVLRTSKHGVSAESADCGPLFKPISAREKNPLKKLSSSLLSALLRSPIRSP